MDDKEQIEACYREMYRAMVQKDIPALGDVLADDFVLVHMTGMRQGKRAFVDAVADGTLNYYHAEHESVLSQQSGDSAMLVGQSRVHAAIFGGGPHTWRLQQRSRFKRSRDGGASRALMHPPIECSVIKERKAIWRLQKPRSNTTRKCSPAITLTF